MELKIFVCGSRKEGYSETVEKYLDDTLSFCLSVGTDMVLIHGGCPGSADEYAQKWAESRGVKTETYPGKPGQYLKRNEHMARICDRCVAFWDGYSRGTSHSVACAVMNRKPVVVKNIRGVE